MSRGDERSAGSGQRTTPAVALGFLLSAASLGAQQAPTTDTTVFELGQVTVIGVATPQLPAALATTVLRRDQLRAIPGSPLGRAVAQVPGVRVFGTGPRVAKPMIRGLSGPRVLVADAGHRLEDYSWSEEDAPSADIGLAGEVQVTRGPASLRYGSDALAGVVNVVPLALPTAKPARSPLRPLLQLDAASNNLELGGLARSEGFANGFGWRIAGSGRVAQDYHAPHAEVAHTGFGEANLEAAIGRVGVRGSTTLRIAHHGGEYQLLEAGATPPAGAEKEEGPERKSLDDRIQLGHDLPLAGGTLGLRAQFQRHSLVELSDEGCTPAPCASTGSGGKEQVAFDLLLNTGTAEAVFQHALGTLLRGSLGAAGLAQRSRSAGPVYLVPSATTRSAGAFLIEEATIARLTMSGGVRVDSRRIETGTLGGPILPSTGFQPVAPRERRWSATSADVGGVLALAGPVSLAANWGTAWRAPTLFELYANGPHLAESRYEVGDPTLGAERSHEGDLSLRLRAGMIRAELTAFRNDVDDFIYVAPTPAFVNGLRRFDHRSTDARLEGGEAAVDVALLGLGVVRARHEIVRGTDRVNDEPLPLIAPARTVVGFTRIDRESGQPMYWLDVIHVAGQERPNPNDVVTDHYTTVDAGSSFTFGPRVPWYGAAPVTLDLLVHNAFDVTYRDFLNRYKEFADEPGRSIVLRVTLGR